MIRSMLAVVIVCAALAAQVLALEVPLTVTERAGVERSGNHVNSGVPFAQGAVADVSKLGLFAEDGKEVPAVFVLRQKWLKDGSVRWATVHFLANAPASGTVKYVVKDKAGAAPAYPVKAAVEGGKATVDTGAIKFTVSKENFNIFDEVWFDAAGKGKYDKPVVEAGKAKIVANMVSGEYGVSGKKASCRSSSDPFDAKVSCATLEIEENTPVRAVVKATGNFMKDGSPTLDYVARIYAVAGSPAVRVSFSVINRKGSDWHYFYGFNELSVVLPVKVGGSAKYTIGASEGSDAAGDLKAGEKATMLQPYSEHYFLGGVASGQGKAKSTWTRKIGWIDLTGADVGVAAGIRYFWQLHPKGLSVDGDGNVSLQIVPKQEKKVEVPAGITSQADTRVDFFTGGARTHELLFAFHKPGDKGAPLAMGIVDPLIATCPTSWYCQDTKAEGMLWDNNPENFKPEYRDQVAAFQKQLEGAFNECCGKTRRAGKRGTEEFGFWSYGAGTEAKDEGFIVKNDWLNTRWDGNYYDFPRAAMVNFWRTGNMMYLDVAQDSALHLADVDVAHVHPKDPKLSGIEHTCPNRGHFRQWWGGEPFGISGNMDSTKCQSLYDVYHMTGDAWFLDVAMLVTQYNMNHTGGALRAIGNRGLNLVLAYEQTGEEKYLNEAKAWLTKTLGGRSPTANWDQYWMYGLPSEPLMQLYRLTGDVKFAQTTMNCCDSLINTCWVPEKGAVRDLNGFTLICYGHAYELNGGENYLKKGLSVLAVTSKEYAGATKSVAQSFRISPYFLYYLTKDYQPPKPVIEKSNANK